MIENIKKYTEIINLFNRLRNEMNRAVQSYYTWRTLYLSRSIKEVGEERAKITVKIFSLYKDFFIQTEDSHLDFFIITILKFFDRDDKSLSLHSLVNKIKDNQDVFIFDTFTKIHPDLSKLEKTYAPIEDKDIYEIKKDIKNIRKKLPVLKNLEDIRNKQAAHNEIEMAKLTFTPNEVENLINKIQYVMNKISSRIDKSETTWDNLRDGAIRDTNYIIESLYKREQSRLKELKEKVYGQ